MEKVLPPNPNSRTNLTPFSNPSSICSYHRCGSHRNVVMMMKHSSSNCRCGGFSFRSNLAGARQLFFSPLPTRRRFRQPPRRMLRRLPAHPNRYLPPPSCCTPCSNPEKEDADAVEAVAGMLQEYGASQVDSFDIAQRSPTYLAMLIDSLRDLDDLQQHWGPTISQSSASSSSASIDTTYLSFKEKLHRVAKQKGDKGMLPFLESIGLRFPSAKHLARSLSSQTLPDLIRKVKCVKEIFFSKSDNKGLLVKNAQRMMMHLSISVDDDVQQTLSFFEKIEARRGGLNMLGCGDSSLSSLVESFPRILLLSLESSMLSSVGFLENVGIPRRDMGMIFLLFPPIIFYDVEKVIKPRLQAFDKVGANKRDLSRMLLKYPWILSTAIQDNYEEILSFFELEKVPKVKIDHAIKSWPVLLGCSVSKLKVMVENFGEVGVRTKRLGQVIATSPQLLLRKPQELFKVVSFLKDLGLDDEAICRVLGRCPELFATSIDGNLEKKLNFLASVGIYKKHLPRVIRKYPELFVCDVDKAMLPRMEFLVKSGLSQEDVASMVHRFSPLLGYSIEQVLRPKLEFLVNTMGKPLKELVEFPRYFSYSLERKIKPRFWVLKGRNIECSLKDMLGKNDEDFTAEYMMMLVPSDTCSPAND